MPGADITGLMWSPRGNELWSGGVIATSMQGKTRRVWSGPRAWVQDCTRDGRCLIVQVISRREIVGATARDSRERNLTWLNWSFPRAISPDSETILFDEQGREPPSVYTRRMDGAPAVRIADGASFGFSPDGRWVVTQPNNQLSRLVLVPTGAGQPRALPDTGLTVQAATFFPDGRRLLVSGSEAGHRERIYVLELDGAKPRAITPEGVSFYWDPISPDGKSIVVRGPEGKMLIYPSEGGEARPVPGADNAEFPIRWSATGGAIFVERRSLPPGVVDRIDLDSGVRSRWKSFEPGDPAGVDMVGPAVISSDEKSYVYSYRRFVGDLYLTSGLR
jgi:dipeptidyl aminopeptidase/acylaminoacyl peptidase